MERKKLYIDGLNLFQARSPKRWNLQRAFHTIAKFMWKAGASGYDIMVFIDASTGDPNSETTKKWTTRRIRDVKSGKREVPQGSNILVGDMFRACGAAVHYSFEVENDHTLAAFAWQDGAFVLSEDSDFLRYHCGEEQCFKDRLFRDYERGSKDLKLVALEAARRAGKIDVLLRCPKTLDGGPWLVALKDLMDIRGAPSGCVKELGNIHGYDPVVRLRRALMARKEVTDVVVVKFPEWEAGQVVWREWQEEPQTADSLFQAVEREELFRACVNLVVKAKELVDVDSARLCNHLFACRSVVCELWLLGQNPPCGKSDFLYMMLAFEKCVDELLKNNAELSGAALCDKISGFRFDGMGSTQGVVEKLLEDKRFGFIKAGKRSVFFHYNDLLFREGLSKGLRVKFFSCLLPSKKWCAFAISKD
jgi:hypothetical protein